MNNIINIQKNTIADAKNGSKKAMEALYHQYSKAMYNICIRMLANKNDAEDVLQEIFIIGFKNLHQLKEENQFGGWMKRITINECIRHGKKKFHWDEWESGRFEYISDETPSWWTTIHPQQIHHAIKQLPDGCRQVFNLYAVEDYSHKQISESLQISESTSKSQYHRAKQLLRVHLNKHLQADGYL